MAPAWFLLYKHIMENILCAQPLALDCLILTPFVTKVVGGIGVQQTSLVGNKKLPSFFFLSLFHQSARHFSFVNC